jgi:hypothetical protein
LLLPSVPDLALFSVPYLALDARTVQLMPPMVVAFLRMSVAPWQIDMHHANAARFVEVTSIRFPPINCAAEPFPIREPNPSSY